MSTLVVFTFRDETGAAQMCDKLVGLQKLQIMSVADAAVVVRRQDGKVRVKQAVSLVGAGALGGAFWGMFIGLLFFEPWAGLPCAAQGDALSDTGVDPKFIKEVVATIEPGHSALFLVVQSWTEDKVMGEIKDLNPVVLQTSLSKDDEAKLKAAFGA